MPTSACDSAGPSFMPSPTKTTFLPDCCKDFTIAAFSPGNTFAKYFFLPVA
jgi:hypothetical protein